MSSINQLKYSLLIEFNIYFILVVILLVYENILSFQVS